MTTEKTFKLNSENEDAPHVVFTHYEKYATSDFEESVKRYWYDPLDNPDINPSNAETTYSWDASEERWVEA